jgi:protein involved in polysaccharide export with SLBB domain
MYARMGAFVALTACMAAGCANQLTFRSGDAQPLLPEAKAFKNAVPMPPPVPRELDKSVLATYVVEPGDVLLVQPVNLDSPAHFPSDQTILPDGKIDLGQYGRLLVAGKPIEAVEAQVQAAVVAKTPNAGQINVRIVGRNSKIFYVLGQVNSPGAFPLQGRETVLDGIVAAGGLNSRGSRNNIILSRPTMPDGCRIVLPVCYRQIVQLGDTTTNYQLQPGDRIYVPALSFCDGIFGEDMTQRKECSPCKKCQQACPWPGGDATVTTPITMPVSTPLPPPHPTMP